MGSTFLRMSKKYNKTLLLIASALLFLSIIAYGVFGCGGVFRLDVWTALFLGLFVVLIGRNSSAAYLVAIPLSIYAWINLGIPMFSYEGPSTAMVYRDLNNVKQIAISLNLYETEYHSFPDRLSSLQTILKATPTTFRIFSSPRGAGKLDSRYEGPLRKPRDPDPGPVREVQKWADVDDGDYLYIKPENNAKSDTILVMTRPGLLYHNKINIYTVGSECKTLEHREWTNSRPVLDFIAKWKLSHQSISTGGQPM